MHVQNPFNQGFAKSNTTKHNTHVLKQRTNKRHGHDIHLIAPAAAL